MTQKAQVTLALPDGESVTWTFANVGRALTKLGELYAEYGTDCPSYVRMANDTGDRNFVVDATAIRTEDAS